MSCEKKILLLEDYSIVSKSIAKYLTRKELEVVTASNVREAIDALMSDSFDLLVSDLGMKDGISGDAAIRYALAHSIPTIAITASSRPLDEDIRDYCPVLRKPFSPDELLNAIRDRIHQI